MERTLNFFESFLKFIEFFSILSNLSSNLVSCLRILSSFSSVVKVKRHEQTQKLQLNRYRVTAEHFTELPAEHYVLELVEISSS